MNPFSAWRLASGAYMPMWKDRIEYALARLPPDPFGRLPAWAWAYYYGCYMEDLMAEKKNW